MRIGQNPAKSMGTVHQPANCKDPGTALRPGVRRHGSPRSPAVPFYITILATTGRWSDGYPRKRFYREKKTPGTPAWRLARRPFSRRALNDNPENQG